MTTKSCFIMGLPETGKTTYLAALWYGLNQAGKTIVKLKEYSGDHNYLAQISENWLSAKKALRTNIQSEEKSLRLTLLDNIQQEFEVTFPDLSGESFQQQYVDREMRKDTANYIKRCEGILFFVNPLTVQEVCLISEISKKLRAEDGKDGKDRDPIRDDPTDVQLVELLQFVKFLRGDDKVRLGVVISAWDTIDEKKHDRPEKYIKERLPFLWQYIASNKMTFDVMFYGVSAQGGSLETDEDMDALLAFDEQMDRIIVVDNNMKKSNDITLPLWMVVKKDDEE